MEKLNESSKDLGSLSLPNLFIKKKQESSNIVNSSMNSSESSFVSMKEPPKVYEEIIQKLESDIRDHIRIEQ